MREVEAVYELNNRAGASVKWDSNLGRWVISLATGYRIFTDIVACGDTVVIDGSSMVALRGNVKVDPKEIPGLTLLPKPSGEKPRKVVVD